MSLPASVYVHKTVSKLLTKSLPKQIESKFDFIQLIAELYLMTSFVVIAILMNLGAFVLWVKNKKIFSTLKYLACSLIVADQLYLISLFPYLIYRPRGENSKYFDGRLELKNDSVSASSLKSQSVVGKYHFVHYNSVVLGVLQCFSMWMLYFCASEANTILRQVVSHRKGRKPSPAFPIILFLLVSLYFSNFLPEARQAVVEICQKIHFLNGLSHNTKLMPFQNHWDFVLNEVKRSDFVYIVYFSLFYTLITYIIPYVIIIVVDKNIIDALHLAQRVQKVASSTPASLLRKSSSTSRKKSSTRRESQRKSIEMSVLAGKEKKAVKRGVAADNKLIRDKFLYPCLVISVTCNVFLVCVALKMIILTFKLFEFAHSYVTGAHVFFKYLNTYSNFIQFLKAAVHLPAIILYDYSTKRTVVKSLKRVETSLMRKRRKKEDAAISHV